MKSIIILLTICLVGCASDPVAPEVTKYENDLSKIVADYEAGRISDEELVIQCSIINNKVKSSIRAIGILKKMKTNQQSLADEMEVDFDALEDFKKRQKAKKQKESRRPTTFWGALWYYPSELVKGVCLIAVSPIYCIVELCRGNDPK